MQNTKLLLTSFTFVGLLALAGCSFPGVYKIDIQQGNVVTQDMIDQLRPGMTRRQVRFIMGNPLLTDTFHADRWDYLYTLEEEDKITKRYLIKVYFDNNQRFDHYEGQLPDADFSEENQLDSLPKEETNLNTVPAEMVQ